MSNVVDDRVVNMRFDNSNFERNVSTSIGTLDKLKQSLDFSKSQKSLESLQYSSRSFNMGGVADAIMAIQDRFSTMGIVGMTIIQNLTNSALGAVKNIASKITNMIISGGISRAMNIEGAKFQLEGLGIKYEDVFDAIDYAVTNTAYSLDAAANAASQLSAAGLDYKNVIFTHEKDQKELTQMSMALRAVSGVAAQTQTDYAMVARYFQDVANAGKVTGATLTYMTQVLNLPIRQNLAEGLKAIASGSMEASESVKKAAQSMVKDAEVSTEDVDKFVKDGLISFDMFSTIMFGKFADHAVDANRTIAGVMANIRSAFSKIGAEFVLPIIEIDGIIVKMLDSIRAKVNQLKPSIIPFAKSVTDSIKKMASYVKSMIDGVNISWVKPFFTGLGKIIEGLTQDLTVMSAAFSAVFPRSFKNNLKSFAENFQDFGDKFLKQQMSFDHMETLADRFKGFFSVLSMGKTILGVIASPLKGFVQGIRDLIPASGDTVKTFTDWAKNADQMLKSSEKLKEFSSRLSEIGRSLGRLVMAIPGYFQDSIAALKNGPQAFFNSLFDSEEGFINRLGKDLIYIIETLTGADLSKLYDVWDSICNFFNKLFTKLSEIFSKIIETVKKFVGSVKESIGKESKGSIFGDFASQLDKDTKPLESVFDFVKSIFSGFFSFLNDIAPVVKGLFNAVVIPLKTLFTNLKEFAGGGDFLKQTSGDAPAILIVVFLTNLVKQIKFLVNDVTKIGRIESLLGSLGTSLTKFAQSMQMQGVSKLILSIGGAIFLLALSISMLASLDEGDLSRSLAAVETLLGTIGLIMKALTGGQLKKAKTELDGFTGSFKKIKDGLGNFLNAMADSTKYGAISGLIVSMAASVFILAEAAKAFANMEPDQVLRSVAAIEVLLNTMTGIVLLLSNTMGSKANASAMDKSAKYMIALSIAIRILASAAKVFGDMDWEDLGKAGAAITVLMGELLAFSKMMQNTSIKNEGGKIKKTTGNMLQLGIGFIALAAALKIMASVAKDFGGMKWEELGKAGAAITVLLAEFTAFAKINTKASNMVVLGIGLIEIAAAMKIFALAAKDFGGMKWEELGKAGAAITGILALVTLFAKINDKGSAAKIAVMAGSLITIGIAMNIFALSAKAFASLDWGELGKAGAALAGIFLGLSLFSKFTSGGNLLALSAALIAFSVALLMMVPAIMAFSTLSVGGLVKSLVEIAGIIAVLAIATKLIQPLIGGMAALSGALLLFGAALVVVGTGLLILSSGIMVASKSADMIVDFLVKILTAVVNFVGDSIPMIMNIFKTFISESIKAIAELVPQIVDSLLGIIIDIINMLADRIPELSGALQKLVSGILKALTVDIDFDPEAFTSAMIGLSAFLVALGVAATLCQQAMLGVLAIMAVMAEVVLLFAALNMLGYESNQILEISQGLSMILVSLAATMAIISLIPIPAAAMGVAGLAIVVAGIAAILAILGGLAQIPGFEWLLGEGKRILVQIGDAIGEFVGSIIGGLGVGLTNHLPKIADNLSQFAVRLVPFIATMKLIDLKVVAAAGSLVGIIMALTAADVLNALTSWLTGGNSIEKFGEQIEALAPHLKAFAEEVRGINAEDTKKAAEAGKALAEMAKALPNEGGVAAFFAGENDMEKFGEKLEAFGKSLVKYSIAILPLNVEAIEKSAAAGKMVAEMAAMMPNTGGVAGFFAGNNDMDEFGRQLEEFGKSLAKYSIEVMLLNVAAIEKSAAAGQIMVDLASTVPNTGGAVSWFTGNNDLNTFGEQLVIFGECITEYSNIVADIDGDAVKNSAAAGQIMVDLEAQLKNSGGAVSWFTGDDSLKSFGHNLQSFGESIVAFSDTLSEATNLQEGLAMIDGLIPAVEGMIGLANALVDTDGTGLTRFARSAKGFVTALSQIGGTYVDEFIKEFTGAVEKVEEGIATFVSYITTGLLGRIDEMTKMGQKYVRYFIAGMGSKMVDVKNKGADVGKAAVTGLQSVYPAFYNVGVNCIMGVVNGLYDEASIEALAARLSQIAQIMIDIVRGRLKEKSPSRVFMEIGQYAVDGLAIGVRDETGEVVKATRDLADATVDNMQTVIDQVRESIDDNMDLVPTITPIVDLSNVTKGASTVNDLFNKSVISGNIRANSSVVRSDVNLNEDLQNEQQNGSKFGTTFIQNNYSPKALNRIEIYRQTRNQFAQYREAMQ